MGVNVCFGYAPTPCGDCIIAGCCGTGCACSDRCFAADCGTDGAARGGLLLSSSRRVFFRIIKILLLEIFDLGFILLLLYCEICIYVFL